MAKGRRDKIYKVGLIYTVAVVESLDAQNRPVLRSYDVMVIGCTFDAREIQVVVVGNNPDAGKIFMISRDLLNELKPEMVAVPDLDAKLSKPMEDSDDGN